jgi:hypothetical protein
LDDGGAAHFAQTVSLIKKKYVLSSLLVIVCMYVRVCMCVCVCVCVCV